MRMFFQNVSKFVGRVRRRRVEPAEPDDARTRARAQELAKAEGAPEVEEVQDGDAGAKARHREAAQGAPAAREAPDRQRASKVEEVQDLRSIVSCGAINSLP